ncbi:MAG: hypothetical protein ACI4D8_02645 [Wujia sp.]
MKKKMMTVVAALAIMAFGTTALAADSPTAGTTTPVDTVAEGQKAEIAATAPTETPAQMLAASTVDSDLASIEIVVEAVSETTINETLVQAKNVLSDVKSLADLVAKADASAAEALKTASTDPDAKVTASVKTVLNLTLDPTSNSQPSAENPVKVTVSNSEYKAGKTYIVLHYVGGNIGWETIPATVDADGKLSFYTTSFSPFAIVELIVGEGTQNTTPNNSNNTNNTTTSPDTGDAIPVAAVVLLFCVAGAVICTKKVRA